MGSNRRTRSVSVLVSTIAVVASVLFVPLAPAGADAVWSITPTPNPAGTINAVLNSVACTRAASCFAVGRYQAPKIHRRQVIERWNGSRWSIMSNPAGSAGSVLFDVTCPSAGDCYAVGTLNYKRTLAEHWSGKTWSLMTTPNPTSIGILFGVSCPTRSSCFAVGAGGATALIEHWNGHRWSIVKTAKPIAGALVEVACPGPATCSAVGFRAGSNGNPQTLIGRWDGHGWSTVTFPAAQSEGLEDISCPSTVSCVAVGSSATSSSSEAVSPLIYRWDGMRWSRMTPAAVAPPNNDAPLNGIACPSANRCVAVGSAGPALSSSQGSRTMVQQWDGSRWSLVSPPNPSGATSSELNGVACPSATTCMTAGDYQTPGTTRTLAEQYA